MVDIIRKKKKLFIICATIVGLFCSVLVSASPQMASAKAVCLDPNDKDTTCIKLNDAQLNRAMYTYGGDKVVAYTALHRCLTNYGQVGALMNSNRNGVLNGSWFLASPYSVTGISSEAILGTKGANNFLNGTFYCTNDWTNTQREWVSKAISILGARTSSSPQDFDLVCNGTSNGVFERRTKLVFGERVDCNSPFEEVFYDSYSDQNYLEAWTRKKIWSVTDAATNKNFSYNGVRVVDSSNRIFNALVYAITWNDWRTSLGFDCTGSIAPGDSSIHLTLFNGSFKLYKPYGSIGTWNKTKCSSVRNWLETGAGNYFQAFKEEFIYPYIEADKDQPPSSIAPPPGGGGGSTGGSNNECYDASFGWGWILCPGVNFMGKAVAWFMGLISNGLSVNLLLDTDGNVNTQITAVWAKFLPIANIALAIVFLIIIYSTATSIGLSNYNIKKILPRLIVIAIAVNTSFYICAALADVSNILGNGASQLIGGLTDGIPTGLSDGLTNLAGVLTLIAVIIAIFACFGLALVALLTIVISIVFRQIALIVLVIISPLAIVCALLPNTEQWYKKWRDNYVRMLFVYPLFMVAWNAVYLVMYVIQNSSLDKFAQFMFIAALNIAPVFMIIPIFKMGGNIMSKVTGAIQSNKIMQGIGAISQGAIDRGRSAMANSKYGAVRFISGAFNADKNIKSLMDASAQQTERDFRGARGRLLSKAPGSQLQRSRAREDLEKMRIEEQAAAWSDINDRTVFDKGSGTTRSLSESEKAELGATGKIDFKKRGIYLSDEKGKMLGDGTMKFNRDHRLAAIKNAQISGGDADNFLAQSQHETDLVVREALSQRAAEKKVYHTAGRYGEAAAKTLGNGPSGLKFNIGTMTDGVVSDSSVKYADAAKSLADRKIDGAKFIDSGGSMTDMWIGALAAEQYGSGQAMTELIQLADNLSPEQVKMALQDTEKAAVMKAISDYKAGTVNTLGKSITGGPSNITIK